MISLELFLATSLSLYAIGLYCLATKHNMIRLLIGIAILGNAANLNFITFSAYRYAGIFDPLGHVMVLMAIVLEACVIAIGLTIVIHAYRHYRTLDVWKLRRLKW